MKTKKSTVKEKGYEDLYICMSNAKEKRKYLLTGIKTSLVMQEEHERVLELRKEKAFVINEIKKGLEKLNKDYQQVKKELPNVKNVITYTEKEISELENQIHMLKEEEKINVRDIKLEEHMKDYLEESKESLKEVKKKIITTNNTKIEEVKPHTKKKTDHKLTKVDRIKNNLSVIEAKLKNM
jgi:chromosome segregation ATPase